VRGDGRRGGDRTSRIDIRSPRPSFARASQGALVAGSLALYCLFQHLRVERLWPVMTAYPLAEACAPGALPPERTRISVIRAREELRGDLGRYLEGAIAEATRDGRPKALPDLALVDSPRFEDLSLWPRVMDSDARYMAQYRSMSIIPYLLLVFGSRPWIPGRSLLRLLPVEKFGAAALSELYRDDATGPFLRKYWPELEPALASRSED
jgi:hypothetical protein